MNAEVPGHLSPSKVVLFGGAGPAGMLADTWTWNGPSGWQEKTPTRHPPARFRHAAFLDSARGQLILFGGDEGGVRPDNTWS